MAKRQALGDVLDVLLSPTPVPASPPPAPPAARREPGRAARPVAVVPAPPPPAEEEELQGKKDRITVVLGAGLLDKARDAAFYTPGLSLTDLVAEGLRRELTRREKERGEPFPQRTANLRPGRKVR